MENLEIKLNLNGIQPKLRKIIEKIDICVILEYKLTDSEFILKDSYVVHKNDDFGGLPLKILIEK